MWCFLEYATPLHNELHLICRIVCAFCHAMPHLNRTCIIPSCASCHAYVMVVYCVDYFFPGCSSCVASVSFRSCEDSFDSVRLSSSWTSSSSLRDFTQDDHTLEITSIFAC